jgi:hypothetical protein
MELFLLLCAVSGIGIGISFDESVKEDEKRRKIEEEKKLREKQEREDKEMQHMKNKESVMRLFDK